MTVTTQPHRGGVFSSAARKLDVPIPNYIGGAWVQAGATESLALTNPATGEALGRVPRATAKAVDDAVAAAPAAFPAWRATPAPARARYLFKLKALLDEHFDEISSIVTQENGKTLDESRGSVKRGIENVEHACGIPTLMMG
ncbi:MAG: aldehyde dehydrogenase family protein, partial [Gemmatimonadales bacterium]|nr:aldehyde dehydrogenase family protein [Gemmatimonadales bacterium]